MIASEETPLGTNAGLLSAHDGRIEPLLLLRALRRAMTHNSVLQIPLSVIALDRINRHGPTQWRLKTSESGSRVHDAE